MSFQSVMSAITSTITSTIFPRDASYSSIRPHHLLVSYALLTVISASSVYRKLANSALQLLSQTSEALIPLVYRGIIPDPLIRYGIRIQLYNHLAHLKSESAESELHDKRAICQELHAMPIAIETDAANAQHYEVPAKFYDLCLGPCKKYSSGLWPTSSTTFEESEVLMLDLYCERAKVKDGMHIVDLGMSYIYISYIHTYQRVRYCVCNKMFLCEYTAVVVFMGRWSTCGFLCMFVFPEKEKVGKWTLLLLVVVLVVDHYD